MSQARSDALFSRASGILLHITSLPSPYGVGDLGAGAYRFADALAASKQSLWQILPLQPPGVGNSPYAALSAFAGNPLLISPQKLAEDTLLNNEDLAYAPAFPAHRVDYQAASRYKFALLRRAFERFRATGRDHRQSEFESFCERNRFWLEDFALFMALKEAHNGAPWTMWESDLVAREPRALSQAREALASEIHFHKFVQFVFFSQWFALKSYANNRKIGIVGDMPIFVAHDSADVWSHQEIFTLDKRGMPLVVAGVPPDYFSPTGQRWGNPLYRWEVLAQSGYEWWINRMREILILVDVVRIDHFRGFEAYWEIPATEPTAVHGRWAKGPGEALFKAVEKALGRKLSIIVEDLGMITPEVLALRDKLGYPGMKVLHFAFGSGPDNPYLPHNYDRNCVVYTATHDNDTTVGWFQNLSDSDRTAVRKYIGTDGRDIAWDLIRLALMSVANYAITPLQDILSLGSEARMNLPGRMEGNWAWRYTPDQLTPAHLDRLGDTTTIYGRAPR